MGTVTINASGVCAAQSGTVTTAGGSETIGWILYDDFGPGQYRVWANDTNDNYYVWQNWQIWVNNTSLDVLINRTAPGVYNYTIEYYDMYNLFGNPDSIVLTHITYNSNPRIRQRLVPMKLVPQVK